MSAPLIFLIAALATNAGAQLLYKGYARTRKKALLPLTVLSFTFVPYFNYEALKGLSIDVVYMATSLTIVMVSTGSMLFFSERLEGKHYLGGLLILLGILIYNS